MPEKKKIKVCQGPNCTANGSLRIMEQLEKDFGLMPGGSNNEWDLDFCGCSGYCELGPNVWVDEKIIHHADTKTITEKIKNGDGIDKSQPVKVEIQDGFLGDI